MILLKHDRAPIRPIRCSAYPVRFFLNLRNGTAYSLPMSDSEWLQISISVVQQESGATRKYYALLKNRVTFFDRGWMIPERIKTLNEQVLRSVREDQFETIAEFLSSLSRAELLAYLKGVLAERFNRRGRDRLPISQNT